MSLPPTEQRNPRSAGLDDLDTLGVLRVLHAEDQRAVRAVAPVLPQLARVVDAAAERMRRGGTVHYFGAGTSGRLGVLDASELLPTFNLEPGRVTGHIAGGPQALVHAVENAEDSAADGASDAAGLGAHDVAVGLTASGSTPYVRGALETARAAGAFTVLISSNPAAPIGALARENIVLNTGPEAITGSTRLKAGTAQKLALNGFSTALMIALGRTWDNLMVSVVASNKKLRARTVRILREATDLNPQRARAVLDACDGELKTALVATLGDVSADRARRALDDHEHSVRAALVDLAGAPERGASGNTGEPR